MNRLVTMSVATLFLGLPAGLTVVGIMTVWGRRRRPRRREVDVVAVATLLLVRVGAGIPLIPALAGAAGDDPEFEAVVRRARRLGSAAALASASGPMAPLLHRLADAAISGAPPEPAIRSFLDSERRRRHTLAIEKSRRLPVRLMVPMTLLVLPGFVLMVYGPAFISLIGDLIGPLAS